VCWLLTGSAEHVYLEHHHTQAVLLLWCALTAHALQLHTLAAVHQLKKSG
jgi:hypothetical protein